MSSADECTPKNTKKGVVFNIQRFSIHDGPGIRTTVFMKGCFMKCAWCSNPESQKLLPQLMVRDVKCTVCGRCAEACTEHAISLTEEPRRLIDWSVCTQCMKCAEVCIYESLGVIGKYMDVEEIVNEVKKDEIFYKNSGGGATISGGEPLFQHEFVVNLLKALKEEDIHTALDTCGYVSFEVLQEALPYVDLLLFDIKHLDAEEHRRYTGVDNALVLSNARSASKMVRTWFRVPLIQGFNDSSEDIRKITQMAKELNVEKLSLLPYHEGGKSKSYQIGETYSIPHAKAPDENHIQRLRDLVSEIGVATTVGN